MRMKLSVQFQGEEGIDAGGVSREWYQVTSLHIYSRCMPGHPASSGMSASSAEISSLWNLFLDLLQWNNTFIQGLSCTLCCNSSCRHLPMPQKFVSVLCISLLSVS